MNDPLRWPLGQHGTVIAITGGGKTFWGKNGWLPQYRRGVVVDVEAGYDFPEPVFRARSVSETLRLAALPNNRAFMARVEVNPETDAGMEKMDSLCYGLLDKGHDTGVYIDECTAFTPNNQISPGYKALITRARKRKITVLSGTQRPAMLHKDIYTQSIHHVWFFIGEYDAENWLKKSARSVMEHMNEIPFPRWPPDDPRGPDPEGYKWLYVAPDTTLHKFNAVKPYPWEQWK